VKLYIALHNIILHLFSKYIITLFLIFFAFYPCQTNRRLSSARAAGIPVTETFSLRACLGNPVDIRQWNINGLPTDDVSIDSAICTQHALRWPLLVDPQGQVRFHLLKSLKQAYLNHITL